MGKQLIILAVLLCPAWAVVALPQGLKGNAPAVNGTTCAVTITANGTGATHLLMGGIEGGSGTTLTSVSTGAGTWTLCGVNCQQSQATAGAIDLAYLNAPTSSTTTITFTYSPSTTPTCWVAEFTTTTAGFTLETISSSNKISDAACTTACAAPTVTITGSSDAVFSIASCGGTCSGTITGVTTLYEGGDGGAAKINTTSSSFNWNQSPSSTLVSASLAFKEASGAAVCNNHIALMGAGCN